MVYKTCNDHRSYEDIFYMLQVYVFLNKNLIFCKQFIQSYSHTEIINLEIQF